MIRMVVLIGFMGAGKSSIGRILADHLGVPFVDSDVFIERREGRTIREIFSQQGESHFREIEYATVVELLRDRDSVISLGGGAILDARTRAALRGTRVIYLEVPYDEAMRRVSGDQFRPLLGDPELSRIYAQRLPLYEEAATDIFSTDGRRQNDIALDLLTTLTRLPAAPSGIDSVLVATMGGAYEVHVGGRLVHAADALIPRLSRVGQVVLIEARQDREVGDQLAKALESHKIVRIKVDERQPAKSLGKVAAIAERMAAAGIHKHDLVIGVGGEVICELAGFIAAIYGRGLPVVLVPTTLIAQADSSVGGKNAISLDAGRNYLGTIHQPVAVISDIDRSRHPSQRGWGAGVSEIAKHALITGQESLDSLKKQAPRLVSRDAKAVQSVVAQSVRIKAEIVGRDERESGERLHLGYGHTFARAIEGVLGLDAAVDGAPLSLGMMAAAHLSHRIGLLDAKGVEDHRTLLKALGLPTSQKLTLDQLHDAWRNDKRFNGRPRFVLLNSIGDPSSGHAADEYQLQAALADLAEG